MIDTKSLKPGLLFDNRYTLVRPLSSDGGSADVWLARDRNTIDEKIDAEEGIVTEGDVSTGLLVAIKAYRPQNALDVEGEQMFRDEFKIVHDCHHTNLLPPTDFSIYGEIPYLVFPYCEAGSSQNLIGKLTSEHEIWKYIHEVASGLQYLHSNKPVIVHQDIKPANVLIDKRKNYVITDFGISTTSGDDQEDVLDKERGTFEYMAPERFAYDYVPMPESDIWSFGATLFELLTQKLPYGQGGGGAQAEGIPLQASLDSYPSAIRKIILSCLSEKPKDRPTPTQLIEISQRQLQTTSVGNIINSALVRPGVKVLVSIFAILLIGFVTYIFWPQPAESVTEEQGETQTEANIIADNKTDVEEDCQSESTVDDGIAIIPSTEHSTEENVVTPSKPSPKIETTSSESASGTLTLDYGIWEGVIRNGQPAGKGKITYNKPHDIGDAGHHEAQPGDVVEGVFQKGSWDGFPRWTSKSEGKVRTLQM